MYFVASILLAYERNINKNQRLKSRLTEYFVGFKHCK